MMGAARVKGLTSCASRQVRLACQASSSRKVECRHILVNSQQALQDVAIKLESGDNFAGMRNPTVTVMRNKTCCAPCLGVAYWRSIRADLASVYSQCPSRTAGGRIGWVIRGMADSAIEEAVLDKPVGHVTQVESSSGHHLIEVLNENEPRSSGNRDGSGSASASAVPAASTPPPPQRSPISAASVRDLASVLADTEQVRAREV